MAEVAVTPIRGKHHEIFIHVEDGKRKVKAENFTGNIFPGKSNVFKQRLEKFNKDRDFPTVKGRQDKV